MKFPQSDFFRIFLLLSISFVVFLGGKVFADPPENLSTDIIVKIGDSNGYENGDVLVAASSKRTLNVHAQHLVHPKNMQRTSYRTINSGSLLEVYLQNTKEYKFERISQTEVRRTNLWTGEVDVISNIPNAKGEYMDVPLYIKRRLVLNPNDNQIFGSNGNEYWFGGNERITDKTMDVVWDEIENRSSNVRSYNFPFTETEKNQFAVLKVKDLTDAEVDELTRPLLDVDGVTVIKARKKKINLNRILNANERANIDNPGVSHDLRGRTVDINGHIIDK